MGSLSDLKKRIIEISYKRRLAHIGSNLTAVSIIDEIYKKKKSNELFVLSQGHAGLALYVVLEKYCKWNAEELLDECGIHPVQGLMIDCSTGSLGHGLPTSVGMALADRSRNVYCLISDGECDEGSIWEALRIAYENNLENLKVYVNDNGSSAYRKTPGNLIHSLLKQFLGRIYINPTYTKTGIPFLEGIQGHYKVLTKDEKDFCIRTLSADGVK